MALSYYDQGRKKLKAKKVKTPQSMTKGQLAGYLRRHGMKALADKLMASGKTTKKKAKKKTTKRKPAKKTTKKRRKR